MGFDEVWRRGGGDVDGSPEVCVREDEGTPAAADCCITHR
jgi:hypothetical protein